MITPQHRNVARLIRHLFLCQIPKTWSEYFQWQAHNGVWLNHYQMAQLIQEQTRLPFRESADLCLEVNPELGGEYWENLPLLEQEA